MIIYLLEKLLECMQLCLKIHRTNWCIFAEVWPRPLLSFKIILLWILSETKQTSWLSQHSLSREPEHSITNTYGPRSPLRGECEQAPSVSPHCQLDSVSLGFVGLSPLLHEWYSSANLQSRHPPPQSMWEQGLQGTCSFHRKRGFLVSPHSFLLPVRDFMVCRVLSNLALPLEDEVPTLTDWEELIFHLNTSCHPRLVAWPSTSAGQFSFQKNKSSYCLCESLKLRIFFFLK